MDSIPSDNPQHKRHYSPEGRAKLSAARKGRKQSPELIAKRAAGMKGHSVSEEARAKISAANTGKTRTKEQREQLSEMRKGKILPSEQKAKISQSMKGYVKTPEHRANQSKSMTGKKHSEERRLTNSRAQTGKKMSEQAKRKISDAQRGEKNFNWKGGRPKLKRFGDPHYSPWQIAVFERDNFTCQHCGYYNARGDFLNAHHIKQWRDFPELRFDVDNGTTLCRDCHKIEHGKKPRPTETIFCACGCGNPLKPDSVAYGHRFLVGHNGRGKKRPLSERMAISATLRKQRSRSIRNSTNPYQLRLID